MDDMEEMLNGLRQMKETNPEVFKQAMQSLGLPVDESSAGSSILDDTSSLTTMAEAIKQMRSGGGVESAGKDLLLSKNAPPQPKGISITPRPGFSFKTLRVHDQMKVFINMAEHEAVDEPGLKKKLDDNGEEVEGMNIPMSVGAPVWSEDKKGAKCLVYDIIVNPVVIKESLADKTGKYRDFICQLGMQYLEQKYKEELDKRYKLPKLKYMGDTIASQMIQDRKSMPKIQEVSSKSNPTRGNDKSKSKANEVVVEIVDKELQYTTEWLHTKVSPEDKATITTLVAARQCCRATTDNSFSDNWVVQPYSHQTIEYLDPIFEPTEDCVAIVVTAEVNSYDLTLPGLKVSISPFKMSIKAPGYRNTTVHLACAVKPAESFYSLQRPYEGSVSAVRIRVVMLVDHADWADSADAGSKTWLLTEALSSDITGDENSERNPYSQDPWKFGKKATESAVNTCDGDKETFAEDKFHLDLPDDVDQYTGVKLDGSEQSHLPKRSQNKKAAKPVASPTVPETEQEFAEDRFHKKDASSQYLINQREQARKDKWDKHEKEKAERANDPNVEYVDMDDFRPGGKYGPKESAGEVSNNAGASEQSEELRKAAEVVAKSQNNDLKLSSAMWTELLD